MVFHLGLTLPDIPFQGLERTEKKYMHFRHSIQLQERGTKPNQCTFRNSNLLIPLPLASGTENFIMNN